jgi:hypothetical protein
MEVGKKELSTSCEHVIMVAGTILRELKVQNLLNNDQDPESPPKTELHHQRWIGDKTYAVRQVVDEGQSGSAGEKQVETNLNEDELKDFEVKWNLLWKPVLKNNAQN